MRIVVIVLAVLVALLLVAAAVVVRPDRPAAEVDAQYRSELSHFVELADGTRMHYLEAGPKGAPPLLLVHGSYDSAFTWERVLGELSKDFRVIAPDLPAHGLTGQTTADRYTMDDMAAAVHGLVEKLGVQRFHLAGNSMGGNTSWLYAAAHPQRVERMVLISASGYPAEGTAKLVETSPGPVVAWFYRNGNPSLLVRSGFEKAVADPGVITDAMVQRSVDMVRRAGSRDAQMKRGVARRMGEQPIERIPGIATQTLVISGDLDRLVPVQSARRFHAELRNSELIIYEGIAHMPQHEAPARLAADMRAFLTKPSAAPQHAPTEATEQPPQAPAEPAPQ